MKRRICILMLLLGALAFPSCVVREPVRHELQLLQADEGNTLVLLLRDSTLLRLPEFSVWSDTIFGRGTAERNGREKSFDGVVAFDDIEYAQLEWLSATGTALFGVPAIVLTAAVLAEMTSPSHVDIEHYTPSSGGSSCPYVYSWNGERYVLEAETFGTSLGRALQRATRHVLPSLLAENGYVHLKIADERPETHYLDRVTLLRVRHARGTRVVLDPHGQAWQVGTTARPLRVRHGAEGLVRSECVFARPAGAERALLLVTARNREMAKGLFQDVFDYLGDETLRFMRDLERDPETVSRLRRWQRRCALDVSLRNGGGVRACGSIDAEATAVSFVRGVPLDLRGVPGEEITVTLDGIAGIWDVEDVRIAWEPVSGLQECQLPTTSAIAPGGVDARGVLQATDGEYCSLLPPQAVEMRFAAGTPDPAFAYSYCVEASGYLHLWYLRSGDPGPFSRFGFVPRAARRAAVRAMMDRPAVVLGMLEDPAGARPGNR